jgi:hypothetical protein
MPTPARIAAENLPVARFPYTANLSLCRLPAPGYNLQVVARTFSDAFLSCTLLFSAACCLAGCAAAMGPGYVVEKQEIQVSFLPQPEPHLRVIAEYHLRNTGIRELDSLDVHLPGRRFRPAEFTVLWKGAELPLATSAANARDTILRFPKPWSMGDAGTIRFEYDLRSATAQEGALAFSPDAFGLPAEGWIPALPQARGPFGFGGVPPKKWALVVRVPEGFLVHASGGRGKHSAKNGEMEFRFEQTAADLNPFVVAGRYRETRQNLPGNQQLRVWSRTDVSGAQLRQATEVLCKTLATYDSLFPARDKSRPTLWTVECPQNAGCFSQRTTSYGALLYGEAPGDSAEMISRDTILFDPRAASARPEALTGPALASGWLGYGQNPGFYEQQPPMSALPAFAAALALEVSIGAQVREQIIRRALAQIPVHASPESSNDPAVSRAKSLLLFYALRDRVGADTFQKALRHMLFARRKRGFDLSDLISAVGEESHYDIGPFIRRWIKRPGVPDDFRAAYSQSTARQETTAQEATP